MQAEYLKIQTSLLALMSRLVACLARVRSGHRLTQFIRKIIDRHDNII